MNERLGMEFFANYVKNSDAGNFAATAEKFKQMMCWYGCAIREVCTKFEVLNDEFKIEKLKRLVKAYEGYEDV